MDRDTRKAAVMDLADELGSLVAVSPALEEQVGVGLPRLVAPSSGWTNPRRVPRLRT